MLLVVNLGNFVEIYCHKALYVTNFANSIAKILENEPQFQEIGGFNSPDFQIIIDDDESVVESYNFEISLDRNGGNVYQAFDVDKVWGL